MQNPSVCGGSTRSKAVPEYRLLHPTGTTLSVGQLVVVQLPATLTQAARLQLCQEHAQGAIIWSSQLICTSPLHPTVSTDFTYIACWDSDCCQSEVSISASSLQVEIGDQLHNVRPADIEQDSGLEWTSCRCGSVAAMTSALPCVAQACNK